MAELYLVRHGQASFGAADYDRLSERGEQQSIWLGEYFARHDIVFDRVICGTLRRHEQTVSGILRGMGISGTAYEQHAGLNEYDFQGLFAALGGDFPELTKLASGSMRDHYRALKQVLQLWSGDKIRGPLPETWAAFQQRVAEARTAIQAGGGQRVLAISSGGPIAVTAQQVLAAPPASAISLNLQIRNSSVSQYFFNAESFQLATFNGIPHLDDPARREFQTYG